MLAKQFLIGMAASSAFHTTCIINLKRRHGYFYSLFFLLLITLVYTVLSSFIGNYPIYYYSSILECPVILLFCLIIAEGNMWRNYLICFFNSQISNIFLVAYVYIAGSNTTTRILHRQESFMNTLLFVAISYLFAFIAAFLTRHFTNKLDQKDRLTYKLFYLFSWLLGMIMMIFRRRTMLHWDGLLLYIIYDLVALFGIFWILLYLYYAITLRDLHYQQMELEKVVRLCQNRSLSTGG